MKIVCLVGVCFALGGSTTAQASSGRAATQVQGPMEENPVSLCDLNEDGDCDEIDTEAFQDALGKCQGEYRTVADMRADVDGDGCVTVTDQQMLEEWHKSAGVVHHGVMTVDPFVPCDLDRDEDCDEDDTVFLSESLGQCDSGIHYNELADMDHDGCVTATDQQTFQQELERFQNKITR